MKKVSTLIADLLVHIQLEKCWMSGGVARYRTASVFIAGVVHGTCLFYTHEPPFPLGLYLLIVTRVTVRTTCYGDLSGSL